MKISKKRIKFKKIYRKAKITLIHSKTNKFSVGRDFAKQKKDEEHEKQGKRRTQDIRN